MKAFEAEKMAYKSKCLVECRSPTYASQLSKTRKYLYNNQPRPPTSLIFKNLDFGFPGSQILGWETINGFFNVVIK
jgi:hypothetical protein